MVKNKYLLRKYGTKTYKKLSPTMDVFRPKKKHVKKPPPIVGIHRFEWFSLSFCFGSILDFLPRFDWNKPSWWLNQPI